MPMLNVWRRLIYSALLIVAGLVLIVSYSVADQARVAQAQQEQRFASWETQLAQVRLIRAGYFDVQNKIGQIDPVLPGLATNEVDLLTGRLEQDLVVGDLADAELVLAELDVVVDQVLLHQVEIAQTEIQRLSGLITENLDLIDQLLGDMAVVPPNVQQVLVVEATPVMERLDLARGWVEASSQEIQRRRAVLATVQKQILIQKSTSTLSMVEDGQTVFSMPVSLGRAGWNTRSGEFAVLDKLGTVWSYWQIWLPYWMGIYYAGSSENGIHGLPFDNAGNVYWTRQVGKADITYGCVMPDDPNMIRLYQWADVGTPVTVVW